MFTTSPYFETYWAQPFTNNIYVYGLQEIYVSIHGCSSSPSGWISQGLTPSLSGFTLTVTQLNSNFYLMTAPVGSTYVFNYAADYCLMIGLGSGCTLNLITGGSPVGFMDSAQYYNTGFWTTVSGFYVMTGIFASGYSSQSPSPPAPPPSASPLPAVIADQTAGSSNVNVNTEMGQLFSTDANTYTLASIVINMPGCSSLPSAWISQSTSFSTSGTNLAVSNTGGTYVQFTSMSGQPNITLSPSTSYAFMISNTGSCSWYYSSGSFTGPGTIGNSWLFIIPGPGWVSSTTTFTLAVYHY